MSDRQKVKRGALGYRSPIIQTEIEAQLQRGALSPTAVDLSFTITFILLSFIMQAKLEPGR